MYSLIKDHKSLMKVDFSNSEGKKFKNKLSNIGFNSLINAIINSKDSLIQMINVNDNSINDTSILKSLL